MDLKEFIRTALVEIVEAIEGAKSELDDKADYICPIMNLHDAGQCNITRTHDGKYYQNAEFDIAVTAESNTDCGGKAVNIRSTPLLTSPIFQDRFKISIQGV
ncbi:MAG: hypothetical protein NTW94_02820 [Legionellales bacterium]|nr:hypothetical protein [Legionellales bacterium]